MTTRIVVDWQTQSPAAQRLLVWAKHDKRIGTTHDGRGRLTFLIPDELVVTGPGGYGAAIDLGGETITISPGSNQILEADWQTTTGIDPNNYTTTKAAPTNLTATTEGAPFNSLHLTWDYDERHTWYAIWFRTAALPGSEAGPWHMVMVPGYKRNHNLGNLFAGVTYDVAISALVTEGHYVPIWSSVSTSVQGQPQGEGGDPGTGPVLPTRVQATCNPDDFTGLSLLFSGNNTTNGQPLIVSGSFTGSPVTNPGDGTASTLTFASGTTGGQDLTVQYYDDPVLTMTVKTDVLPCIATPPTNLQAVCDTSDPTGLSILFSGDNTANANRTLTFTGGFIGGTDTNVGDGVGTTRVTYPEGTTGVQTITVQYSSNPADTVTVDTVALPCVDQPPPPPTDLLALCDETDTSGLSVGFSGNNHGNGELTITGTFIGSPATNIGNGSVVTQLTFPSGTTGAQTLTVQYSDDPVLTTTVDTVALPCVEQPGLPTNLQAICDTSDNTGVTVLFSGDNTANGQALTITGSFTTGGGTATNVGDGTTTTQLTFPAGTEGAQTLTVQYSADPVLTTTVQTVELPCVFNPTEPTDPALTCDTTDASGLSVLFSATNGEPMTITGSFIGGTATNVGDGTTTTKLTWAAGTTGVQSISVQFSTEPPLSFTMQTSDLPCVRQLPTDLTVTCDDTDPAGLSVLFSGDNSGHPMTITGSFTGGTTTNPGDGTTTEITFPAGTTGAQTLTVQYSADPVATTTVDTPPLPCPQDPPLPTGLQAVCNNADLTGRSVLFSGDNNGNGSLMVTGSFTGSPATNPGDGTTTTQLDFPSGTTGAQTLTVQYSADPLLTTTVDTVALPCTQPPEPTNLQAVCDTTEANGRSVLFSGDNDGRTMTITGGFNGGTATNAGDGTATTKLTFPIGTTGAQSLTVQYSTDPDLTTTIDTVVLPCTQPPEPTGLQALCNTDDTTGLSVLFSGDNNGNGSLTVTGSFVNTPATNPGDGTTTTQLDFPSGTTGAQTLTVQYSTDPLLTTTVTTVVLPCVEPPPLPDNLQAVCAPDQPSRLVVAFSGDNHGNGPLTVSGDFTGSPVSNGGDSTTTLLTFPSGTTGAQTLSVRYSEDPALTTTIQTPTLPCPPLAPTNAQLICDETESSGLAVLFSINNYGFPVTVSGDFTGSPLTNPGDNSTPTQLVFPAGTTGVQTVTVQYSTEPPLTVTEQTADLPCLPPVPIDLRTSCDLTDTTGLSVLFSGTNDEPLVITGSFTGSPLTNPGDGTTTTKLTFPAGTTGSQNLSVRYSANPALTTSVATGSMPCRPPEPTNTTAVCDVSQPSGLAVLVSTDNNGTPVTLTGDFSGGTATNPGDGTTTQLTYPAGTTGVQTITIRYSTDPLLTTTVQTADLPCLPPVPGNILATCDISDPEGLTVQFSADNHDNGPLTITGAFDGGSATNLGDGESTTTLVFPGSTTGAQTLTVQYSADPVLTTTVNTNTLPCEGAIQLPTDVQVECDLTDPSGLSVLFSANNNSNGGLIITGSFTGGTATNAGNGVTTTKLTFPAGTTGVQNLTIQYFSDPVLTTPVQTGSLPCRPPEPTDLQAVCDPNDFTRRAVLFSGDNNGNGTLTITGGFTGTTATNPGDGTTQTKVIYPEGTTGARTLTVQYSTDPLLTTTVQTQVLPCEPAVPTINVICDPDLIVAGLSVKVFGYNGGIPFTITGGFIGGTATNPGDGTTLTKLTYPLLTVGSKTLTIQYSTDPVRTLTVQTPVMPCLGVALPTGLIAECDPEDPTGLSVLVSGNNNGVALTITGGFIGGTVTNPGDGTTKTKITFAVGTVGVQLLTVQYSTSPALSLTLATAVLPCLGGALLAAPGVSALVAETSTTAPTKKKRK